MNAPRFLAVPLLALLTGCHLTEAIDAEAPPPAPPAVAPSSALPPQLTLFCQGFVQVAGQWVTSPLPGPVMVLLNWSPSANAYESVYCDFPSDVQVPGSDDPAIAWWGEYLRGRWPMHRAARIIAGSSARPQLKDGRPDPSKTSSRASSWTVVFQRETKGGGKATAERIFVIAASGGTIDAWMDDGFGGPQGAVRTLAANEYAEIESVNGFEQLGAPQPIPPLPSEPDPTGPAHFLDAVIKAADTRRLPQGVP